MNSRIWHWALSFFLLWNLTGLEAAHYLETCEDHLEKADWLRYVFSKENLEKVHAPEGEAFDHKYEFEANDLELDKWLPHFQRITRTRLGRARLRWALQNGHLEVLSILKLQGAAQALHEDPRVSGAIKKSLQNISRYEERDLLGDRILKKIAKLTKIPPFWPTDPRFTQVDLEKTTAAKTAWLQRQLPLWSLFGNIGMLSAHHFKSDPSRLMQSLSAGLTLIGGLTGYLGAFNTAAMMSTRGDLSGLKFVLQNLKSLAPLLESSSSEYLRELGTLVRNSFSDEERNFSKTLESTLNVMGPLNPFAKTLDALAISNLFVPKLHERLQKDVFKVAVLFSVMAELDMLQGFSDLLDENWIFPTPLASDGIGVDIEIKGGLNPFLYEQKRIGEISQVVANDFHVGNLPNRGDIPQIMLLEGQNGEGKSTYIRMVGLLFKLALAGAPVPATEMRFTPIPILSSIKNEDNTEDQESLFRAEVRRQAKNLSAQQTHLSLNDEAYRGTSHEQKVSLEFGTLKTEAKRGTVGISASHSRELQEEEAAIPGLQVFHVSDEASDRFKVKRGPSFKINSFEVSAEEGLPPETLQYAKEYHNRKFGKSAPPHQ